MLLVRKLQLHREFPLSGSDLFTGTLDLLILRALEDGPKHGYAIGRWIRTRSADALTVEEGALYPALHRQQGRGFLESHWGQTETGRRAKFYRLNDAGREALHNERDRWTTYSKAVHAVLKRARA